MFRLISILGAFLIAHTLTAADFVGRFSNSDGVTIVLQEKGNGYGGTIEMGSLKGTLAFETEGAILVGELQIQGEASTVEMYQEEGAFFLTDGSFVVELEKDEKRSLLEGFGRKKEESVPEAKPEEAVEATPGDWKLFTHSSGVSFRHPKDWGVQEGASFLQLTPPDMQQGQEMIYAIGSAVAQKTAPDDPSVAQYLDSMMWQMDNTARRIGNAESFETTEGTAGAIYLYGATNAFTGQTSRARVYVIIGDKVAVSFFAVGSEDLVERRRPVMDQIASSFLSGSQASTGTTPPNVPQAPLAGNLDSALLGYWFGESISTPVEGIMVNSRFTYLFRQDGIVFMGAKGAVNVASQDGSGVYNGGSASGTNSNVDRGRWSVSGGVLTIQWDDGGRFQRNYRVRGKTLEIRDAQGKLITFYER
ncbi:hypothetical protein [Pelagicoccus albus]|uniref:Uncharacterized protein n=1 Tax=Pelagicoccus albus TaxID=415222 RepID=A0A7X1B7V4_9BACT|nr:hypothetical protein [Pelagicoccus albus]MBC2607272.1 hypothetical protein [Pelagicoccus albus]